MVIFQLKYMPLPLVVIAEEAGRAVIGGYICLRCVPSVAPVIEAIRDCQLCAAG